MESYLSTSKNLYASSVINKNEDTRYAEPDPSLRPFFQFLLNSKKRKKRDLTKSPDSRIVEDFINYSINSLRNPVRADSFDSVVLLPNNGGVHSSYKHESDTQYMPVPIYTRIPTPKPAGYGSGSVSGSIYHQTSTSDPYGNWQETPLIFPDSDKKPPAARPPSGSSGHYRPEYNIPDLVHGQSPTFVTPVQLRPPAFVTPVEYQGPTFVTPISVAQIPLSDGNPPPTIVILEDIDPAAAEPPQSDTPVVEQDPAAAAGGGSGAGAGAVAAAAAGAGAAAAAGAGAGAVASAVGAGAGVAGIAGGAAATVTAGVGAGGAAGGGGPSSPADAAQCRAVGGGASKVCSDLITTSSSPADSDSLSFLDGITSLFSSFNFIGPLMITFWSMIFPPMSIILTSGLGVISFLFPWMLPRLWFGRQLNHYLNTNQFNRRLESTNNYYHQPYYH